MRYIFIFLMACILFAIGSSLVIYHGDFDPEHNHEQQGAELFEKDDVVIDFMKSINRDGREKVICYRESHRNFYFFIFQMTLVIVALTTLGVVTKVRLSNRLKKQNGAIEESREALDKSNQALLSGIRYAQRIQQAMLPKLRVLNDITENHFLLYKPKDLVSGDFFWVGQVKGKTIVCAADSTGHGVPGAFLATLGLNTLRTVVETQEIWEPAKILGRVNTVLTQNLGTQDEGADSDGIEMTVFCLDPNLQEARFAGARGLAFVKTEEGLQEFKGDRTTLGHNAEVSFKEQVFAYKSGDWFLQFTDGMPDQFGGPENKKFSRSRMRLLFQSLLDGQKIDIEKIFADWKGTNPQVDDVLAIGYQV